MERPVLVLAMVAVCIVVVLMFSGNGRAAAGAMQPGQGEGGSGPQPPSATSGGSEATLGGRVTGLACFLVVQPDRWEQCMRSVGGG